MAVSAGQATVLELGSTLVQCIGTSVSLNGHIPEVSALKYTCTDNPPDRREERDVSNKVKPSHTPTRYSISTLLQLRATTPHLQLQELEFATEVPTEKALWRQSNLPPENMVRFSSSGNSDDEDNGLDGGVPLMKSPINATIPNQVVSNNVEMEVPIRQPHNPPTNHEAMRVLGFAQWLRARASNLQNRVTAGGRIVPVGPSSPPPTFHMDFIDRIIQVGEEAKRDPSPEHQAEPINWLGDNQNETTGNLPGSNFFQGETNHNIPKELSSTADTSEPASQPASQLAFPSYFEVVANMTDGGVLLRLGNRIYRSFPDAKGTGRLEEIFHLQGNTMSDAESSSAAVGAINAQPNPAESGHGNMFKFPEARKEHETNRKKKPAQSSSSSFTPPTSGSSADAAGNIMYDGRGFPTNISSFLPLVPYNSNQSLDFSGPLVYFGNGGLDGTPANMHIPGNVILKTTEIDDPLKDISDLTEDQLLGRYKSSTEIVQARSSRLKGVEKWLAKDLENMSAETYKGLIDEKGHHIRTIDVLRKDKERIARRLQKEFNIFIADGKEGPQGVASSGNAKYPTGFYYPRNMAADPVSQQPHRDITLNPLYQDPGSMARQNQPSANNNPPLGPQGYEGVLPSGKGFKMHDPAHASTAQQHMGNQALNPKASSALLRPQEPESKADYHGRGYASNTPIPTMGSTYFTGLQTEAPESFRKSFPSRTKNAVSIRHPDGTPIDFKQMHHANKSVNVNAAAREPQAGNIPINTDYPMTHTPNRDATSLGSHAESPASHGNSHVLKEPPPTINWARLPGETDALYVGRVGQQRGLQAFGPIDSSKEEVIANQRANGIRVNENWHLRQTPTPGMASNAPIQEPNTLANNVVGHFTAQSSREFTMPIQMPANQFSAGSYRQPKQNYVLQTMTMPPLKRREAIHSQPMRHMASHMSFKTNESEPATHVEDGNTMHRSNTGGFVSHAHDHFDVHIPLGPRGHKHRYTRR